jgi:hypothetical protein
MTSASIRAWFQHFWPDKGERHAALAEYQELKHKRFLLADIAARAKLFTDIGPGPNSDFELGRRSLALEILHLAEADMKRLMQLAFTDTKGQ